MAYIIDETYFQREYYVPNVDELNSDANKELMNYIDEKSRLLIRDAIGYANFKELDANITNGNLDSDAPQKWLDLVNGVEYTVGDKTYYWKGLKYKDGAFRSSLLTPFVFYYWLFFNQSTMSGVGEVIVMAKNAVHINSSQRIITVWNEFVNQYQGNCNSRQPKHYLHRGVPVIDWIGEDNNNDYVSLVQFISDKSEDYPNAPLKRYKIKNQLGL